MRTHVTVIVDYLAERLPDSICGIEFARQQTPRTVRGQSLLLRVGLTGFAAATT
jgi:hypothetical protein